MLPQRPCETCQQAFQPSRKGRRFCSKKCKGQWQSITNVQYPEQACDECGIRYKPYGKKSRFCSRACTSAANRHLVGPANPHWRNADILCPVCGLLFHQAHKRRKYCSRTCADTARRGVPRSRTLQPKQCLWCCATFQPRSHKNKYCSPHCGHQSHASTRRLGLHRVPERECIVCGSIFRSYKPVGKYCSKACTNIGRTLAWQSTHNPDWIGRPARPKDEKLRQRILARDKTCQGCHIDTSLQVHHIDGNPHHNTDDNLVVVCKECHAKRHEVRGELVIAKLIRFGRHHGRKKVHRIFACRICQKAFRPHNKKQQCCSYACAAKLPRWNRKLPIALTCLHCARIFARPYGKVRKHAPPKFCSRSCHKRYYWQQIHQMEGQNEPAIQLSLFVAD